MLLFYILFALIGSTVPWLPVIPPTAGADIKPEIPESVSVQNTVEPDQALLIETPQDAMNMRIDLVRQAMETLDVVYFQIEPGEAGRAFWGEVALAAQRGVQVRILLDGKINSGAQTKTILRALEAYPNVSSKLYNPLHLLKPWKWHAVLHDKFILVDSQFLLLGGQNITDRFFSIPSFKDPVAYDWDVFVSCARTSATSVIWQANAYMQQLWDCGESVLQKANEGSETIIDGLTAWAGEFERLYPQYYETPLHEYIQQAEPANSISLIANPIHTQKKQPVIAATLLELAKGAKHSVTIQSPYSTKSKRLIELLTVIDAQVDTVYLTNSLASSPNYFAYSNYISTRTSFIQTGMEIHELQSYDSIHGKAMVIDGRLSSVGSLNLDDRSFFIDTESILLIDSPAFAQSLQNGMQKYFDHSLMVDESNQYAPNENVEALPVAWAKRAGMAFASIISRLFYFLM